MSEIALFLSFSFPSDKKKELTQQLISTCMYEENPDCVVSHLNNFNKTDFTFLTP